MSPFAASKQFEAPESTAFELAATSARRRRHSLCGVRFFYPPLYQAILDMICMSQRSTMAYNVDRLLRELSFIGGASVEIRPWVPTMTMFEFA